MKRILVDTNVILDVLLDREPHLRASAAVWIAVETGVVEGLLSAHAVTTIHYLISRQLGAARAKRTISAVLRVFGVASVDMAVLRDALQSTAPDFEDSVTASAAQLAGCDLIVTRDIRGFRGTGVRALTPEAAVPVIARTPG